jgi:hypothetical protein
MAEMDDKMATDVEIAVIKEQMGGLREQQKAHATETKDAIASVAKDVKDLTAIMNRGKGAYAASMAFAGAIGAALVAVFSWVSEIFHSSGGIK